MNKVKLTNKAIIIGSILLIGFGFFSASVSVAEAKVDQGGSGTNVSPPPKPPPAPDPVCPNGSRVPRPSPPKNPPAPKPPPKPDSGGSSSSDDDDDKKGGSVCDKASDPCGLKDDDDGGPPPVPECPAGTTRVSGYTESAGCCPNEYVKTTGSGKGATRTCEAPPPPPPPTAAISQSDITTSPDESFTLTYGRNGGGEATECVLQHKEPGDGYEQIHSNTGGTTNLDQSLNDLGTHSYRTKCRGLGGSSDWVSLNHNVTDEAPTLTLTADEYVVPYDTSTTLRWNSENTVSCTASGAWSGSKSVDGSEVTENLTDTTTYLLQCRDDSDRFTSPASVTIDVESGTGADITTNHSITRNNSDVEVSWNTGSSDPSNCRIETGSNTLLSPLSSNTGSFAHTITGETTFILNCEDGANTDQVTVQILPEFQET